MDLDGLRKTKERSGRALRSDGAFEGQEEASDGYDDDDNDDDVNNHDDSERSVRILAIGRPWRKSQTIWTNN